MTVGLSLYLDALRFLAALIVMWSHLSGQRFSGGVLWQIGPFGQEAVLVFFVLSGFVIGFVTDIKETNARDYAANRLSRMYSVVIPALILTVGLDAAGRAIQPASYIIPDTGWLSLLEAGLFVNQIWFIDTYPGSNVPFWSLGYEVWYYVLFGVFRFVRGHTRWLVLPVLGIFVGPSIVALFPLWLAGIAAYRLCSRGPVSPALGATLAAVGLLGCVVLEVWPALTVPLDTARIGLSARTGDLVHEYGIAACLGAHLVGVDTLCGRRLPPGLPARVVRFLANRTFSVYLYHLPLASFLIALIPWPPETLSGRCAIAFGTLGGCFLLAELTERKKEPWRRLFTCWLEAGTASAGRWATPRPH
jgi:peptidoglycan/LPS O-acetylase OafA/YrhL